MTTNKLEEVAKAIHNKQYGRSDQFGKPEDQNTKWTKVLARTAIKAMRKPSEKMIKAGLVAPYNGGSHPKFSMASWQAMIDAALEE